MNLINVDQEKCLHDGICAAICIHRVIGYNPTEKLPYSVEGNEHRCVECGHCMAVCPAGALSHSKMSNDNCIPLKDNWRLNYEQVEQLLKGRRAVRNYSDRLVEQEIITKIIDTARYTPTGFNLQPVKWMVIHNRDEVKKVSEITIDWMKKCIENNSPLANFLNMAALVSAWERGINLISYNVPHLILAYAPKEMPIASGACTMSLTYLELAALPFGLGTCWAGFVQIAAGISAEYNLALKIPEGYQCFGAMMIGYPKYEFKRIPLRKEPQIVWR